MRHKAALCGAARSLLEESASSSPRVAGFVGAESSSGCELSPEAKERVEALVTELIGRVADKWTMLVVEALTEKGELRFTRLHAEVPGVSYTMLTQTLRAMEREGLIARTVHPVVPPKVEYRLTSLGLSLSAAFCGVWMWAEQHIGQIEQAREEFDRSRRKSSFCR